MGFFVFGLFSGGYKVVAVPLGISHAFNQNQVTLTENSEYVLKVLIQSKGHSFEAYNKSVKIHYTEIEYEWSRFLFVFI